MYKPYRVDFKYSLENQASVYVCAEDADKAKDGALQILQNETEYVDPSVTAVEEVTKKDTNTTLN